MALRSMTIDVVLELTLDNDTFKQFNIQFWLKTVSYWFTGIVIFAHFRILLHFNVSVDL